jgi:hypothetical protein
MTSLLLTLHLLGTPASPADHLRLFPSGWRPAAALGLPAAPRLAALALAAEGPAAPAAEDHRLLVMTAETALGAGVLLANDAVVATVDAVLALTFVLGALGSSSSSGASLAIGSLVGLLVVTVLDLVAVPFLVGGTAYGVSRLFDDSGGHLWFAIFGAAIAEAVVAGGGFLLILLEAAVVGSNPGATPLILVTELLLGVVHVVGIPLAASYALHFGQAVVPQRPAPAAPPAPQGVPPPQLAPPTLPPGGPNTPPPSDPSTQLFPLFELRFG